MKTEILAEPVLVGREQELKQLHNFLESALTGKGTVVLVSGEAGTGKTRLIHEFLKNRRQEEYTLLSGWCLSNTEAPYFPFVQAFKSYYAAAETDKLRNEGTEINAWLTGLKQAATDVSSVMTPQGWKNLTLEVVSRALHSISTERPAILLLEDVHWADSASIVLLHYIARTISSEKVLVLATFRSEELTSDAEGYGHPLTEEIRLMRQEKLIEEIQLSNLEQNQVKSIAEKMTGGKVDPELTQMLTKESAGNALFVVESIRMLYERGNLYQQDDQWRLTIDTLGIPDRFKDVILRRLSRLKFNQRRVLDAASVIGEKFEVELLSTVLNQDSLEVLENLNTIARSTSLIRSHEESFSFNHAKSRQAIYEEISPPLKRGYHKRVAEKLETAEKDGRLPLSEIAYHYAEAGSTEKAVEFALEAGQDSLKRFSNAEAIKHFSYVLDTLPDLAENVEKRRLASEALGDAYYASCMFDKALKTFELLASNETGKLQLRAFRKAMDTIFFGKGDSKHFMALAAKAEPLAALDRLESARIRFFKASYLPRAQSEIEWEATLRVFQEEYSLPDVARTLSAVGVTKTLLHPDAQGFIATLQAAKMLQETGDSYEATRARMWACIALYAFGLFEEAEKMLNEVILSGEKIGAHNELARAHLYLGQVQDHLGRSPEAIATMHEALKNYEKANGVGPLSLILAGLVKFNAKLGNLEVAEKNYRKLTNLPQEDGPVDNKLTRALHITRAQVVLFAAKNQWEEADQSYRRGLEITEKIARTALLLRSDYAWALEKQGRIEEANRQRAQIRSAYLEMEKQFSSFNVLASLMAPSKVLAGEEFEMRLYLVNASKASGLLEKVQSLIPDKFKATLPADIGLADGSIDMKRKSIQPFQVETVVLKMTAPKAGTFEISPQVQYLNEANETKICTAPPVTLTVQPAKLNYEVLAGRISTGFRDLDAILFGGIPEKYAVILAAPSSDERELLISRFLYAGIEAGEPTFYLTAEMPNADVFSTDPKNFYLVICNPQANFLVPNLPNVYRLKGVENLTEIDIAVTKAFRSVNSPTSSSKRFCISLISDVLLQHHAVLTRKWLSSLLPAIKAKGFTVLGVVDQRMHPPEETQAILNLFEGEMRVMEKDTPQGPKQTLQIRRLYNQRYSGNEIVLSKEKIEQ